MDQLEQAEAMRHMLYLYLLRASYIPEHSTTLDSTRKVVGAIVAVYVRAGCACAAAGLDSVAKMRAARDACLTGMPLSKLVNWSDYPVSAISLARHWQ
jgi:hypothetical protein